MSSGKGGPRGQQLRLSQRMLKLGTQTGRYRLIHSLLTLTNWVLHSAERLL